MTDNLEFSLGMSVNPASGFKSLPDYVAFDLCTAFNVPPGNVLLHNTRNGKRAMVKPEVYAALLQCSQFKTIQQHATDISEAFPGMQNQQEEVQKVLQSMLKSGMMVSAKNTCDKLKAAITPVENKTDAPVVTILTWERPEALERLLESISSNCDTEKLQRLYIIDDSRRAENISSNQALVEKFASRVETPLVYFGQKEQQALLAELTARLPEHENAIRFLADQSLWLDHWTAGLSRNLALLLSCGHRLVMMDDDSVCDLYDPPALKHHISFSDDPRQADFFASEADWAYLHQPINPDPISRHMQCLGLSYSEALTVLGQNHLKAAGFENATALLVSELVPDSPVLVTECGSLGCPGTSKNTWLPNMAPDSRMQMLASGEKTTNALNHRKVWSGRNQPHFSPRPNMSQITGFDNRHTLPPYLPILRGQDRLFGNMLDFVFPTSVTLDYPWAIPHLPLPERAWRNRDLNFTPADSFPAFLFEKVLESKTNCHSVSPNDRLSALAAWFSDLADAPAESLTAMHREDRLRGDSASLQELSTLLSAAKSAPVDWQNYLRNGISQLNTDIDKASRADFELKGIPATMESDELIAFWKDTLAGFAQALSAWPEIRQAAAEAIAAQNPTS
jgi:hypothetical protein